MIGQNHIRRVMLQFMQERVLGIHALGSETQAALPQRVIEHHNIRRQIFHAQDANFVLHQNLADIVF